ncbi:hypothetical protein ACRVYO_003427, partial [Acinetobacter baumannii]|nr:hypothetical protein [Acinetobacter baumannii]
MATNWNAVLNNTNNFNDVLAILKKLLALMGDLSTLDSSEVLLRIDEIINSSVADFNEKQIQAFKDLKEAIEVASAAGAGENGWIDTLVLTLTGENLREFNKKTISTLDCIDDLATTLPWPGRTVNVRSVIKDKHLGGGTFVFSADSSKVPDGYIVVAANGGNWVKITVAFPTIDDFGGLGDDPNYDDADAFIRCALSPYTGSNIYLANRQVEYRI